MVVSVAPLGAGREQYYLQELAHDYAAYLRGEGEAPGCWYGRLAGEAFGLRGEADARAFERVFAWRDPRTGEGLGRPPRVDGTLAFDLVFRPAKSVSVLYALGSAATAGAVLAAHHAGVRAAVAWLERHAAWTRRGRNGAERVPGRGLLAVGFDHRTSRAGDPLLHTHLVVVNRTRGEDGVWRTLDSRRLYRHLMAADGVYRAAYQRELTRSLGVAWTRADAHGNREVQGVPEGLVRAFSKERRAVEAAAQAWAAGGRGPVTQRVLDLLAHRVRPAKEPHAALALLQGRWQQQARALGFDPQAVERQVVGRARWRPPGERELQRVFDRLDGPEGLTAQAAVFGRAEVVRALADQLAGADAAELEALADQYLAQRCVPVVAGEREEGRWTTPGLLQVERRLVAAAAGRQGEARHPVGREHVHQALARAAAAGRRLGADQAEAVWHATQHPGGVVLVVGRAGTGKTTTMDAVRAAFQQAGYRVRGLAPTGIAAQELARGAGIDAGTVDRFLLDLARGHDRLTSRDVVVVDEAGMLGTRKAAVLLEHAHQAGAKLVVVGDERQLQSIEAGGWFRALRLRLGAAELVTNRRQQDPVDQQAVELVRSGRAAEALAVWREAGRVTVARSAAEADLAMLTDWWQAWQAGQDVVMLAYRRRDVDALNQQARALLQQAGRLGRVSLEVCGQPVAVGDRVLLGRNDPGLGVANGTRGTVTWVDPRRRLLQVQTTDGRRVTLPEAYWTQPAGPGRRAVDYAYAVTGHRTQGVTVDRALVRGDGPDGHWWYVAATRARGETRVYVVEGPVPATEQEVDLAPRYARGQQAAEQAITREAVQLLATDQQELGPPVERLPTRVLRAEARELEQVMATRPASRRLERARVTARLGEAESRVAGLAAQRAGLEARLARHGWWGRLASREAAHLRAELTGVRAQEQAWRAQAAQLAAREARLRAHEQQRQVWDQAHARERARWRQVRAELAWRARAAVRAAELAPPGWLRDLLGPAPDPSQPRGLATAWRAAAGALLEYRDRYGLPDPQEGRAPTVAGQPTRPPAGRAPLGPAPGDLAQRRAWQHARQALDRYQREQARYQQDHGRGLPESHRDLRGRDVG